MSDTITVIGNLGTDPERRTTQRGDTIASFRVGSTHRRFDRERNAWVDAYTNWYAVSAFRALGEHALASLHKGDRVVLTGTLRMREWDNGTKQGTTAEVDADAIGHDLLWGTTSYLRSGSVGAEASATSGGVPDTAAAAPARAHENLTPHDGLEPAVEEAGEPRMPELQWAGGADGEPPF